MHDAPFRTIPRSVHPRELARINQERMGAGLPAWMPPRAALQDIVRASRVTGDAAIEDAVRRHIGHPDEHVGIALASLPRLVQADPSAPWVLYDAAVTDAERSGHHWNPLMDALAASHQWPQADKTIFWDGNQQKHVWAKPAHRFASLLRDWIESRTHPDELHLLLDFYAQEPLNALASGAAFFTADMLWHLYRVPSAWARVPQRVPADLAGEAWSCTADLLRTAAPGAPEAFNALQGAETLLRRFAGLPAEMGHVCVGRIEGSLEAGAWPPDVENKERGNLARCFTLAAQSRGLSDQQLETLRRYASSLRKSKERSEATITLVRAQAASPALWRAILSDNPPPAVRQALAHHPDARLMEDVRAVLMKSRDVGVLSGMMLDAAPEQFSKWFRLVAAKDAPAAARVLEQATPEQLARLKKRDIAPLLGSPDERVRMGAIRAAGQTGGGALEFMPGARRTTGRSPSRI